MTDLPKEVEALLQRARTSHDPSAEDAERVRQAMYAAIAAGAALPADPALSAPAGGPSGLLAAPLASKLLVAALVLGGGAGLWAWQRPAAAPTQARPAKQAVINQAPVPSDPAERAGQARVVSGHSEPSTPAPTVPEPVSRALPESIPLPFTTVRPQAKSARPIRGESRSTMHGASRATSAAEPTPPAKTSPSAATEQPLPPTTQEELNLLRSALGAINGGQLERGLALLEAHAARYPGGVLGQERQGLRVVALCGLGRFDLGRREQALFLRDHGQSPLAARVRAACGAREGAQ